MTRALHQLRHCRQKGTFSTSVSEPGADEAQPVQVFFGCEATHRSRCLPGSFGLSWLELHPLPAALGLAGFCSLSDLPDIAAGRV